MTEGDNTIWQITGAPEARGSTTINAGLTIENSKSDGIFVDYERAQGNVTTSQTFIAGLRYRL
jgi:uncharacterized protein with beta-barrel porin domain